MNTNEPLPYDFQTALNDLASSSYPGKRKQAARILAKAPATSAEIVQALVVAGATDSDPSVRIEAMLALDAPVHRAFLQDRPDFLRQTFDSATQAKAQVQHEEEEQYTGEFQRRLGRERRNYLVFIASIFGAFALMFLLVTQYADYTTGNIIVRIFQVTVFILAGLFFWMSWRNWRCPACDSWLSGFKAGVNPFFASSPTRCPHCGKRLL